MLSSVSPIPTAPASCWRLPCAWKSATAALKRSVSPCRSTPNASAATLLASAPPSPTFVNVPSVPVDYTIADVYEHHLSYRL